jgi:hypothetical protein
VLTLEAVEVDRVKLLQDQQEDRVSLFLEHQEQLLFQQAQEQTQLQHYLHQLVVVKLLHLQFLEI